MKWHEFIVYASHEAEESISNLLNENGANGVVIDDLQAVLKCQKISLKEVFEVPVNHLPDKGIRIKAYFSELEDWSVKYDQLKLKIESLSDFGIDLGHLSFDESIVEESDWENEWKKYFDIQKITDSIVIVPSWLTYQPKEDEKVITIDPGMAFGTGTHPTTILSTKALEKYLSYKDTVLDVGVGSGILSIAANLLGAKHVYSYDIDPVAIKSAKMNIDLNNMSHAVTIKQSDLLQENDQSANIIVANILADIIVTLIESAKAYLKSDGYFIMSGIIEEKQELVIKELELNNFEVIEIDQIDHWVSIVAKQKG